MDHHFLSPYSVVSLKLNPRCPGRVGATETGAAARNACLVRPKPCRGCHQGGGARYGETLGKTLTSTASKCRASPHRNDRAAPMPHQNAMIKCNRTAHRRTLVTASHPARLCAWKRFLAVRGDDFDLPGRNRCQSWKNTSSASGLQSKRAIQSRSSPRTGGGRIVAIASG